MPLTAVGAEIGSLRCVGVMKFLKIIGCSFGTLPSRIARLAHTRRAQLEVLFGGLCRFDRVIAPRHIV